MLRRRRFKHNLLLEEMLGEEANNLREEPRRFPPAHRRDAYYDTCILALCRRGMTLRVRRQRRQFVDTIKAEAPARLDLLERREWEAPMKSQPALDALKLDRQLSNAIEGKDLRPIDSGYAKEEIIYVARLSEATLPKSETARTRLDRQDGPASGPWRVQLQGLR